MLVYFSLFASVNEGPWVRLNSLEIYSHLVGFQGLGGVQQALKFSDQIGFGGSWNHRDTAPYLAFPPQLGMFEACGGIGQSVE